MGLATSTISPKSLLRKRSNSPPWCTACKFFDSPSIKSYVELYWEPFVSVLHPSCPDLNVILAAVCESHVFLVWRHLPFPSLVWENWLTHLGSIANVFVSFYLYYYGNLIKNCYLYIQKSSDPPLYLYIVKFHKSDFFMFIIICKVCFFLDLVFLYREQDKPSGCLAIALATISCVCDSQQSKSHILQPATISFLKSATIRAKTPISTTIEEKSCNN